MISRRSLLAMPAALLAQSDAETWRPLFDGKSLAGWTIQDGPQSAFYVDDGAIVGSASSEFPAWLRSDHQYENFELELEWFPRGWSDGGLYFCCPEHGQRSRSGFKLSLFHQVDREPRTNSMGSLYPVVAPQRVNVRPNAWNQVRVRLDWPKLEAWSNGESIHALDLESHRALRYRLRSGFLGLETLSYPLRFRNLRVRELPAKQVWQVLYQGGRDLERWTVTESNQRSPARFQALGAVLRADGLGNLTSKERFRDFELQMYVRGSWHHNGGVLFRSVGGRDHYEIQLHDVEEAHYPTGSLYSFRRAAYPRIATEEWFLFQLLVKDAWCLVRINGEDVMEYDKLERLEEGSVELQAHQAGRWIEYKQVRIRRI